MAKVKSKVKKPAPAAEAVSLNPRDMVSAGLKDDFRGKITAASYAPWDYNGSIDEPVLAAHLIIQELDDDGDPVEGEDGEPAVVDQHWSAGDLTAFAPSEDGSEPTDGEGMEMEEGPYLVRVGKRTALNNNTNFAHLMRSIIDSGTAAKKFTEKNLTATIECLVGLDGHWNRVPQQKRAGLVTDEGEGGGSRGKDVLVVTKVYGYGDDDASPAPKKKTAASAKDKAKVKSKKAEPEEDEDEDEESEEEESEVSPLDQKTADAILEILAEAPGNKIKKGKLAAAMLKAAGKDKDKAKMVKRCSEEDFLGNAALGWTFDEDTGVLALASEDDEEEEEEEDEE